MFLRLFAHVLSLLFMKANIFYPCYITSVTLHFGACTVVSSALLLLVCVFVFVFFVCWFVLFFCLSAFRWFAPLVALFALFAVFLCVWGVCWSLCCLVCYHYVALLVFC